jgi:type VI protein secretion system component Hcp
MAEEQRFFFLDLRNAGVPKGGCTKQGHVDWLELGSWDFSMYQHAEPNVKGGRPSKTAATGTFGFTITHNGPALFANVAKGAHINGPVTFEAERGGVQTGTGAGVKPTTTYFRLIFNNLVVSNRDLGGDEGQKSESVRLAFEKVQMSYAQIVNGNPGPMTPKAYDMKSGQAT